MSKRRDNKIWKSVSNRDTNKNGREGMGNGETISKTRMHAINV